MKVSELQYVKTRIIENLLMALEVAAQSGDVKGAVYVSHALLKIFKKSDDYLIEFVPELRNVPRVNNCISINEDGTATIY